MVFRGFMALLHRLLQRCRERTLHPLAARVLPLLVRHPADSPTLFARLPFIPILHFEG